MSPVFDCTTPQGRADAFPKVVAGVRAGQLVVLPTDTVYGIGADAFIPAAVQALLDAKGRGREMPPPVLVADAGVLDALAGDIPDWARALVQEFWPGPLTLVLQAQSSLAWDLGETAGTVAVRMPDDEVALELLRQVGPMAVSSANRTGYPASRSVVDAATQLGASVTFYLDGGPVRGGLASTIVDCTGSEPVILRQGALAQEDILAVVARVHPPAPAAQDPAPAAQDPAPAAQDPAPAAQDPAPAAQDVESAAAAPEDEPSTDPLDSPPSISAKESLHHE